MDDLAAAAARGVKVTILTNDGDVPALTFKWSNEQKWWGAISRYRACGLEAVVVDMDGDLSNWELRDVRAGGKGMVLTSGETHECKPYYHFDACLVAAEAALRAEVKRRKASVVALRRMTT